MAEGEASGSATATATVSEPRRLRGHKAATTCCIAARSRPGLVVTSGEDGCVCWFDLRTKDVLLAMDIGENPVSSLCFKPGNEDIIYVSSGNEVKVYDVHMAASWKPLESYNYNKEEINQITCNSKSSFLAAADDSGDIKIIDIHQQCLYKTLRAGHGSICSSAQFLPWRPWEIITGGLDSKLITWDFSRGRPLKILDLGKPELEHGSSVGQCLNPAFVHAIAVPEVDLLDKLGKICVLARGDGVINVINIDSQSATIGMTKSSSKPMKGSQSRQKRSVQSPDIEIQDQGEQRMLHLDYSFGGHTAAVSCVAFSMFGEKGKYIISGGNDKMVKAWNWSRCFDAVHTNSNTDILHLDINLKRKVNWLCTTSADSENLVICDTSKVVKVFTIA